MERTSARENKVSYCLIFFCSVAVKRKRKNEGKKRILFRNMKIFSCFFYKKEE